MGIEAASALNQLAATAGSLPKIARVDLAAIVLNREKLLAEPVRFGEFLKCICRFANLSIHFIL